MLTESEIKAYTVDIPNYIQAVQRASGSLERVVRRWKSDADQYQKQVEEARAKKLPHDQMLSMMVCLRACAKEVEAEWIKLAVAYNTNRDGTTTAPASTANLAR